ncbi:MAG: Hsp33 family molecular chaperone HslO [Clostridiales bacterium]|nr:Hsp33 family molecular chaperone HslO [Clostridiales bacterium]
MESCTIIKSISKDRRIRLIIAELSSITDKINSIHKVDDKNRTLLEQTAIGTVLLGCDLKNDGTNVSAVLRSDDGAMSAVVIYDFAGGIRGYFRTQLAEQGFEALNGAGSLTVMCDDGRVGLYTSTIPLSSASMQESLEIYLKDSMQHEGVLRLSNNKAFGVLISPVLNDEISFVIDRKDEFELLSGKLEVQIKKDDVYSLLEEHGFDILDESDPYWTCTCSKEAMENVIKSVGKTEALSIIEEMGKVEVSCPYCKKAYSFDNNDIDELFDDKTI